MLPHADGISNTLGPRTIMTGLVADYKIHCAVPVGAYCEVHEDPRITNTERSRTIPAIALNATGNVQGSVRFLSLTTGKCVVRGKRTDLPMTQDIIDIVHNMASAEGQQRDTPNFIFEWSTNMPINRKPFLEGPLPTNDILDEEINDEEDDLQAIHLQEQDGESINTVPSELISETQENESVNPADDTDNDEPTYGDDETLEIFEDDTNMDNDTDEADIVVPNRYNLRGNKIDYSHRYFHSTMQISQKTPITKPPQNKSANLLNHAICLDVVLAQYGVKTGVRKYGEAAVNAIMEECNQLDDKNALHPIHKKDLTKEQKLRALRVITIISGRMKRRTVADGSTQHAYTDKGDLMASTVSNEGLFLSIAIDAAENRSVATCDVVGAYLNATMNKLIYMVYKGEMVN